MSNPATEAPGAVHLQPHARSAARAPRAASTISWLALLAFALACAARQPPSANSPPPPRTGIAPATPSVPEAVARARTVEEEIERANVAPPAAGTIEDWRGAGAAPLRAPSPQAGEPVARAATATDEILTPRLGGLEARDLAVELVLEGIRFESGGARLDSPTRAALDQLAARLRLRDHEYLLEIRSGFHGAPGGSPDRDLALRRARAVASRLAHEASLPSERIAVLALDSRERSANAAHAPRAGSVTILVLRPATP